MRRRTALTVAGSAGALLLLGGVAFAAVQAVDTDPGPQVVIPRSSAHPSHSRGADDPVTHDVNDDRTRRGGHGGHGSGQGGHDGDD